MAPSRSPPILLIAAAMVAAFEPSDVETPMQPSDVRLDDDAHAESMVDQIVAQRQMASAKERQSLRAAEKKVAAAEAAFDKRGDRKAIAIDMHELWCAAGKNWQTMGPCMKHAVAKDLEYKKIDHKTAKEKMKAIDALVSREVGQQQSAEMHDWYCGTGTKSTKNGRKKVVEAAADSPLRAFCDGWAQQKLKQEL